MAKTKDDRNFVTAGRRAADTIGVDVHTYTRSIIVCTGTLSVTRPKFVEFITALGLEYGTDISGPRCVLITGVERGRSTKRISAEAYGCTVLTEQQFVASVVPK